MSTLTEIEQAAEALPVAEKQQLMLFLGANLRDERISVPEPRDFSQAEIQSWIERDEGELRRFRSGR
jgi:hypothetical protein